MVLAADLGTSICKAALFDSDGEQIAFAEQRIESNHQPDGRVEQDPEDWMRALMAVFGDVLRATGVTDSVDAIALSTQSETLVCVNQDGVPLRPFFGLMEEPMGKRPN